MKKFFLLLSVVSASVLTGCDNENSVNPQPLGTAKVSGTVFAEFDYTNNDYETVNNKKFVVRVYDDNSNAFRTFEGTTDANGNYSFDVTLGNQDIYVYLDLVDFKQVVKYDADDSEEEIFYGDSFNGVNSLYIEKGQEYIRDIYYNN